MKKHKSIPFKVTKLHQHALLVQVDEGAHFYDQLHHHPEIQITAIEKGEGVFYAGNNMNVFSEKEVFVIGSNVPHLLKNSNVYYSDKSPGIRGVSLFFDEYSFGKQFFEISELSKIKALLNDCKRVIKIKGAALEKIHQKIVTAEFAKEEGLIISFLEILSLILQSEKEYLNAEEYHMILNENEGNRLNDVLDYTFQHFSEAIKIEQIAKIACLSRSQFSYFFKLHTGKTYIEFLNGVRIENACISLKNTNHTIEQICYIVGFQNVSNFVRHFKKNKGLTPSNYRKSWRGK